MPLVMSQNCKMQGYEYNRVNELIAFSWIKEIVGKGLGGPLYYV